MKLDSVGEVIAERRLMLLQAGTKSKIVILLGKPQKFSDPPSPVSTACFCAYQIKGLGDEKVRYAGGVDGVQAIELAMKIIGTLLSVALRDRPGAHLALEEEKPEDAEFPWPYR